MALHVGEQRRAYHVLTSGTQELFYRKSDLAYSHETKDGELVTRSMPPRLYLVWPLGVAGAWAQTYRFERPAAKASYDASYGANVEAEETVTVPAGTFRTLKIVYRHPSTKSVIREQWYSPDVRMWIRTHEPSRDEIERTIELVSFTPAGR